MRGLLVVLLLTATAHADAPYSLGWSLRPAAPASVVRSDTAIGFHDDGMTSGSTVASTFLASYRVAPELSPLFRIAVIRDADATTVSNPLVGVTWAPPIVAAPYKLALFGGLALPLGTGGGKNAIAARSSMDNALFAINDLTPIVGVDVAYVADGLTLQLEATLFELFRVRNEAMQPDAFKTNFTTGAQVGYFFVPWLSVAGELRYQRWLSTPALVEMDATARDALSAALGVRVHVDLGGKRWLRPGISYARALNDPLTARNYQVLQIDVPLAF